MRKSLLLLFILAVCFTGCNQSRDKQETAFMEKITVINGALPMYRFTIPEEDAFGNYTRLSAQFLIDPEHYGNQARVRAYGVYPFEYMVELGDIVFLDFGEGDRDRNAPYLLSNVIGTNRRISAVSDNAGPNTWFTLEFPLNDMRHQQYDDDNFPLPDTTGDLYFALGLGTGSASIDLTYYIKEVMLLNDDGSRSIISAGSGFDKPAFAGYPANISVLSRVPVSSVDTTPVDYIPADFFTVRQIYPWLYSMYDPQNVYCYLIVGNERALLFDTAYGFGNLPAAIRNITDKPLTVILSHAHGDHANGAYQFDEVWLHEGDFELFRSLLSEDTRRENLNRFIESGEPLPEGFDAAAYISMSMDNIRSLDIGQVFDLESLSIEVIAMEGHTAGSIGLLVREHGVLFTGDAASSHVWLFLNESLPMSQYIAMLERTVLLDFAALFSGHSDAAVPKSDFYRFINVARNATAEKSSPYNAWPGMDAWAYQEDGAVIVFRH
ncbi:MAG: MBL fold metallo-hydrolase [Treponema sp.]|nr:MBL fold metallo-hydrolase [Treponema sp.]